MPKFPVSNERQLYRFIKGKMWTGYEFTESKEQNKSLAKFLRSEGVPARAFILPETNGMNYGMQAPERYVVYIPVKLLSERKDVPQLIAKFYEIGKGCV